MMIFRILIIVSFICITGCAGNQVNLGGTLNDHFGFSARNISGSETRYITLTRSVVVPSSLLSTCTLPAGRYTARAKNSTGYFYYAPHTIEPANWLLSPYIQGIYLDKDMKSGNVFARNVAAYSDRPVRGVALPRTIFKYIKKS